MVGCSRESTPVSPVYEPETMRAIESEHGRVLWGWYDMYVSDDHSSVTVVPARGTMFHFNALGLLETFGSDNLEVASWMQHTDGSITAAIKITHPLEPSATLHTGFDVRGIVMLPHENEFPELQARTPGVRVGQNALLNPDGYTRRWNPTEYGTIAKPFGYHDGMMIQPGKGALCTSTVNPYVAFFTTAYRRYFSPGISDERHYKLSFRPGAMHFAYAVDASWGQPDDVDGNGNPWNVPGSFPLTCNSTEPYLFLVKEIAGKLESSLDLWAGGNASVSVYVEDWQDNASVFLGNIRLEAPDIFDGAVNHSFKIEGKGYSYYKFDINNVKATLPGKYPALIAMTLSETDPYWQGPVPFTAYHQLALEVVEVNPPFCNDKTAIHNVGPGIYDILNTHTNVRNDCSFMPISVGGQGGLLFDGGITGGTQHIQYAAIPGLGGVVTAYTMVARSGTDAGVATIIEANEFNGHLLIVTTYDNDNLLVYNTFGKKLMEKDLGTGNHEPLCMATDKSNGDIWMVVELDDGSIHLERWSYVGGEQGAFDYVLDPSSTVDLMPFMTVNPRPLGVAVNSYWKFVYFFHADINGSIEVFDISETPPVHTKWSRAGVVGAPIIPTVVPNARRLIGGDIMIDYVDGDEVAKCRMLVFANLHAGGSKLVKLDAWAQTLGMNLMTEQYSCAAINNLPSAGDRSLILFPLSGAMKYSLYLAPVNW